VERWCIGTGASANDMSALKLMFMYSTVLHVSGVLGLKFEQSGMCTYTKQ
jgi:hypothetical protein